MSSAYDLILGYGQRTRRDDGVGPWIAERLAAEGLPAQPYEGEGSGLIDLWEEKQACLVIDAVSDSARPGRIIEIEDWRQVDLTRSGFVHSSHRIGLPEAVALGAALGRMPDRLTIIGVAGADFSFGEQLSPPVSKAAESLVERLTRQP